MSGYVPLFDYIQPELLEQGDDGKRMRKVRKKYHFHGEAQYNYAAAVRRDFCDWLGYRDGRLWIFS